MKFIQTTLKLFTRAVTGNENYVMNSTHITK